MRFVCFAVAAAAAWAAPLKVSVDGHAIMLHDVYLNGAGPFRMLLDTGNATSIVRPAVARRLNLQAVYTVDQASAAGVRRVPVAILDEVRAGEASDRSVEAIIGEVYLPGVDGVLGESWLVRHDYLLDYRNRSVALDAAPAGGGVRTELRSADGRPVVVARIDGRLREMVVDSGASTIVLYEQAAGDGTAAKVDTNGGVARAEACKVRLGLGERERLLGAVRVDVPGLGPGLLPAAAFGSVFVSNRKGFVEFGR